MGIHYFDYIIGTIKSSYKASASIKKYSPSKGLNGKKKTYRDHPKLSTKGKPVRPPRQGPPRQPYKGNTKPLRTQHKHVNKKHQDKASRRDSSYGAPAAYTPVAYMQPKVIFYNKIR